MNHRITSRITKAAAFALAVISSGVNADVITLNNGDRITGTVGNITGGNVTVTTAYAGDIIIGMANVVNMQTDSVYDVTLASGDQVSGQIVENGVLVNGNVRPARIGDITLLAPPPTGEPIWTSRVDVFASFSNGNSDTQSISILGNSQYIHGQKGENEHNLNVYIGTEEAFGATTKEQLEIDYIYRRYLANNWYVGGSIEYFRDAIKMVDSRWTVGALAGKVFWDNPLGRFAAEVGVSQVFEDLNGDNESNPAARAAIFYNRWLTPTTELYHTTEALTILGGGRGEIYTSQTGLRFTLSDALSASLRYDFRHETNPPPGAARTDTTYAVGVGYTF